MHIEYDIKLDFKDVLFKPKRSTIRSRNDVDLSREFIFKHSKGIYSGIPIMAANMDTTGTFEMAKVLSEYSLFTTVHKHYTVQDWIDFSENNSMDHIAISSGIGQSDFDKMCQVLDQIEVPYICLDVANGYSEHFVDYIRKVRERFDKHTIIAGNVVTSEMTEQLILNGADMVKCGIGGGCFKGDTKVLMANGTYQNISDITPGEYVINREGKSVKVLNVINKGVRKTVKIKTNNWYEETYVTPDHRYWIGDCSTSSAKTVSSSGIAKNLDKLSKTIPKKSKYKWKEIQDVDKDKMFVLYPNTFQWNCPDEFSIDLVDFICRDKTKFDDNYIMTNGSRNGIIKTKRIIDSGYNLGYFFGLFLGDGCAHCSEYEKSKRGSVHFYLGSHETNIIDKIEKIISNLFGLKITKNIRDERKMTAVNLYSKPIADMLSGFGKKFNKFLPDKYYCKDIQYVTGLYDGLLDSDGHCEGIVLIIQANN
jgi:hypothetical protein